MCQHNKLEYSDFTGRRSWQSRQLVWNESAIRLFSREIDEGHFYGFHDH